MIKGIRIDGHVTVLVRHGYAVYDPDCLPPITNPTNGPHPIVHSCFLYPLYDMKNRKNACADTKQLIVINKNNDSIQHRFTKVLTLSFFVVYI